MSDALEGLAMGLIGGIKGGADAMSNIYKEERQNAARVDNETQLAEARAAIELDKQKQIEAFREQQRQGGKAADLKFEQENAGLINRMAADKAKATDVGAPLRNEQVKEFKSKADEQKAKNEWEHKYESAKPGSQEEKALHRSGVIRGWIKPEQETETVTSIERDEAGNEVGRVVSKRPAGTAKPKDGRRGLDEIIGGAKKETGSKETPAASSETVAPHKPSQPQSNRVAFENLSSSVRQAIQKQYENAGGLTGTGKNLYDWWAK